VTATIRILLVDDHPMVRQGLAAFFAVTPDLEVVAECADAEAALDAIEATRPDLVLVDLELVGRSGLWLIDEMRRRALPGRAVVLTSYADPERARAATRAGARAFLLKRIDPDDLAQALRQVHSGRSVFDPEIAGAVLDPAPAATTPHLTPREREVLDALLSGLANKEIADALGISPRTVKGHVGALLAKLGCLDRTQAVIAAYRLGLAPAPGERRPP
jgi:DNA-binding NarL/FixJ family response regulator